MKNFASRCPIHEFTEIPSKEYHENPENLQICDDCKNIFIPGSSDSDPIDHPSIACYDGFITI
jgi:hypothetical protein